MLEAFKFCGPGWQTRIDEALAQWLKPQHRAIASINSPMQCMMKEICAQCLQPHRDPVTGETRRFLTGPTNCEITGVTFTPDGKTMFINVQHPGESPTERSDPKAPGAISNWPDKKPGGRPRSVNVVIRKIDGGVIGS